MGRKTSKKCECPGCDHCYNVDVAQVESSECGAHAVRLVANGPFGSPKTLALCAPCAEHTEKPSAPISAPGAGIEELQNDIAALEMLSHALEYADASGFDPGNEGDPDAVRVWLKEKIAETENTIDKVKAETGCDGKEHESVTGWAVQIDAFWWTGTGWSEDVEKSVLRATREEAIKDAGTSTFGLFYLIRTDSGTWPMRATKFTFDGEKVYDGVTDDTRWNGFLNVWVTPETHTQVVRDLYGENPDTSEDSEYANEMLGLEVDGDGLISYANGYATYEP